MCFYFCSSCAEQKPRLSIVLSVPPKTLTLTMRKSRKWSDNNLIFSSLSFFSFLTSPSYWILFSTEKSSILSNFQFKSLLIVSHYCFLSFSQFWDSLLQSVSQQILTFTAICQSANSHLLSQLSISHFSAHNCLAICLLTYLSGCLTSIDSINIYLTLFHILSYQLSEQIDSFAAMTSFLNHFEVLTVKNTVILSALQKIFCIQFLKVHPDKHSKKKKNKWMTLQQELQNFYNVIFIKSLHLIYIHQFATELKVYFNYTKVDLHYKLSMYNAESKTASEDTDSDSDTSEYKFHEWFNENFEQNEQNKQKEKNSFNTADEEQEVDNTFKKHFTNDDL